MEQTSVMWKYIHEEYECLKKLWSYDALNEVAKKIAKQSYRKVFYVASGSSLHVAKVVSDWMERYWQVEVTCMPPFEFMHRYVVQSAVKDTLVIAVSQTGTSRGTLEAIQHAQQFHYPILTLTEAQDTPIAKAGQYYLNFMCGNEDSNAKTKGYSANLVLMQRLILLVSYYSGKMDVHEYETLDQEVKQSVETLPNVIEAATKWVMNHPDWAHITDLTTIGYGSNLATAMEGALKLLETMSITTMFTDIEEFSHGMHRAMHKDSRILLLCSDAEGKEEVKKTAHFLRTVSDYVLLLDASKDAVEEEGTIVIPCLPNTESSLLLVAVIQVLSVAFPELLGKDPNYPYNQIYTELIQTRV
ncbi:MAG: SIS domain-containing protein [Erysipelotrichaceae bacterium]|nr:SIS domain-containing protein [Erysipelotrichaceae bacterium]